MKTIKDPLSVLIIEDNPGDQLLLQEDLINTNLSIANIVTVGKLADAFSCLKEQTFSIIFLDLFLPDSSGMESFNQLINFNCKTPVVISSGLTDTEVALKAISSGAQDFLIKGEYSYALLEKVVRYSIERKKNLEVIKKNHQLLKASEESYRHLFDNNPAAILIWEMDTLNILEINQSAIELYGYTKEEFLEIKVSDIWPEKQDYLPATDNDVLSDNYSVKGVFKNINKHREVMNIDITSHKIIYKGKEVALNLANNVTEKICLEEKLAEEKLKKQYEITDAVIAGQEKERYFLGIELHDNINQILATSRLYLECIASSDKIRKDLVEDSRGLVIKGMDEIRNLSQALLPPSLGQVGLTEALTDLIEKIQKANKTLFTTQWKNIEESLLSEKMKLTVFRIVQEQINNILKHANATTVLITISQSLNKLELNIVDDGVGFDTAQKRKGVGLRNIESRSSLFHGNVTINSEPGKGCKLNVIFPI